MHLLSLLTPNWTSIFVGYIDISFDKDRPFGVAANLDHTRFGWSWHSNESCIGLDKVFSLVHESRRLLKFDSEATASVTVKTKVLKYVLTNRVPDTLDSLCCAMSP